EELMGASEHKAESAKVLDRLIQEPRRHRTSTAQSRTTRRLIKVLCAGVLTATLAACGGGGGGGGTTTYTIGGAISGLGGTVVLQNNGGDNLTSSANGAFTFATAMPNGGAYNVSVLTQPAGQTCSVTNASGKVSGANVATVQVDCVTNPVTTFAIGGT